LLLIVLLLFIFSMYLEPSYSTVLTSFVLAYTVVEIRSMKYVLHYQQGAHNMQTPKRSCPERVWDSGIWETKLHREQRDLVVT